MKLFDFFRPAPTYPDIEALDSNGVSKETLHRIFEDRRPVLIKGAAKNWDLMSKWTKDYIVEHSGSYVCNIISDSRPASSQDKTTLRHYFTRINGKSTLTLDRFDKNNQPAFLKDIPMSSCYFNLNNARRFFFYHSVKDAGTLPHSHGDAFNILQLGKKSWAFFDASQSVSPSGYEMQSQFFKSYSIGTHAKDWFRKELPKLGNKVSDVKVCIQEAGDIVYVPVDYSHAVLNLSEVMGLVVERNRG